jgi:hypothetical protein
MVVMVVVVVRLRSRLAVRAAAQQLPPERIEVGLPPVISVPRRGPLPGRVLRLLARPAILV